MSKSGWSVGLGLAVLVYASAPAAGNDTVERQILQNTNLELTSFTDVKTTLGTQAQGIDNIKALVQQNTDTINGLQGVIGSLKGVQETQNTSVTQLQAAEAQQFTGLGEQIGENGKKLDALEDQIKNLQQTIQTMQAPAPSSGMPLAPSLPAGGGGGGGIAPPVTGGGGGGAAMSMPAASQPASSPAATAAWNTIMNDMAAGQSDPAQFTEAQIHLGEFISKYPNDPKYADARFWFGVVLYDKHQYSDAISQLQEFMDLFPDNSHVPSAALYRGLSYAESGQKTQALTELRAVEKNYPGTDSAKNAADEIKALNTPHEE